MLRSLFRLMSLFALVTSVSRGPKAVVKNRVRRAAHRGFSRSLRKMGL